MALSLSRNAKFYVTTLGGTAVQEIGILDGFSFSQASGTQNVTLNEAGTSPARGQNIFNTSKDPVDWSFTSYVRPTNDGSTDTAPEELLWNALVSGVDGTGLTEGATSFAIAFTNSNKNQLLELDGYFVFSDSTEVYKLSKMVVNSASLDFDIDGIAQITWSGFASSIVSSSGVSAAPHLPAAISGTVSEIPAAAEFILNRLSTCTLAGTGLSGTQTLALTGGNLTIDNGISYVTPETLGVINTPVGHQTGTRSVTGNMTAYLSGTGSDTYDAVLANTAITNSYAVNIQVGGGSVPHVHLAIAQAHLELPQIDTADVMGVTINFTALESTFATGNDEIAITYYPTQPA